MKLLFVSSVVLLAGGTGGQAHAMPNAVRSAGDSSGMIHLIGNTSSNSSSNTSSNSSSGSSSYVHTHSWSVDSDDGRRRRIKRGTTRIERYSPNDERYYRYRRY
jgi:hypothetical protein